MNLDMKSITARVESKIDSIVSVSTKRLFAEVINETPVDTGSLTSSWLCTVGTPAVGVINSTAGTFATFASEFIMYEAVPAKAGEVVYLTNNQPYVGEIENEGKSWAKSPNGMVDVSVKKFPSILAGAIAL
jgi:hypothetical protein|tara:strand:- start:1348 stop:1740 length:393 start_codon:yes stop_codon:yes gene_type:complete